jgi:broad specificity phosphatase PhoE
MRLSTTGPTLLLSILTFSPTLDGLLSSSSSSSFNLIVSTTKRVAPRKARTTTAAAARPVTMMNEQDDEIGGDDTPKDLHYGSEQQQSQPVTNLGRQQQQQHQQQQRRPHSSSIIEEPDDCHQWEEYEEERVVVVEEEGTGKPSEIYFTGEASEDEDEEDGGNGSSAFAEAALHSREMASNTRSTAGLESNWQTIVDNNNNKKTINSSSSNASLESNWYDNNQGTNHKTLPKSSSTTSLESSWNSVRVGLHRRRTLYLIRHGEAIHNVLEAQAQSKARTEAEEMNLTAEQTWEKMEEARQGVLLDASLRDAPLTDKGREQAKEAAQKLQQIIDSGIIHAPTEAMCSPLSRCLETCKILLENAEIRAHIRMELTERKTQYPPDTAIPLEELLRCTRGDDRFVMEHIEKLSPEKVGAEAAIRESKEMLRQRAGQMFDLLMEMKHRHVLVVSHKGFLRELERGLLELPDSPLFGNCEVRVYRVIFTMGDRQLHHLERLH